MPVFYRDVMYREGAEGKDEAYLKLYDGHDWKWSCVRLDHTDMEYLRKCWSGKKASAPTLEKRHQKYFLRFSYKEEVTLTKTPVKEQIICSVDLGINTDAVCTIMRADGTVLGRRFIDHPSYRTLGRIRRFQREHGSAQTQGRWAYTKRLNTELGKKTAGAIIRYAEENHADVIVFEYQMCIRDRFYYANAPPCKQGFSLTTDFTWRILLCTMKYLARLQMLQTNGI